MRHQITIVIHRITITNMIFRWFAACEHQPNDQHQYYFHLSFPSW
jgi:hypothetical protein